MLLIKWSFWEQSWVVQFLDKEKVLTQWVVGLDYKSLSQYPHY